MISASAHKAKRNTLERGDELGHRVPSVHFANSKLPMLVSAPGKQITSWKREIHRLTHDENKGYWAAVLGQVPQSLIHIIIFKGSCAMCNTYWNEKVPKNVDGRLSSKQYQGSYKGPAEKEVVLPPLTPNVDLPSLPHCARVSCIGTEISSLRHTWRNLPHGEALCTFTKMTRQNG